TRWGARRPGITRAAGARSRASCSTGCSTVQSPASRKMRTRSRSNTDAAVAAPSRAGHSIGRWEGDTLVVDTVGFAPGILAGSVAHTDGLHVVERFTLDPETLPLKPHH